MKKSNSLYELLDKTLQHENRGVGHTTNALKFCDKINGIYIVNRLPEVKQYKKLYPKMTFCSLKQAFHGILLGIRKPIVFDPNCIQFFIEQLALESEKNEELENKIDQIKRLLK